MYDVATEDKIADLIDDLRYTWTALSRENRQRHPATVKRLCLYLTQRLADVVELATNTLDPPTPTGKD